jgi:hypothetical protein
VNGIPSLPGKPQLPVEEKDDQDQVPSRDPGRASMGEGHLPTAILSIIFLGKNAAVLRLLVSHPCFAKAVVCAMSPDFLTWWVM